jgi:hypothetical protein
MGCSWRGVYFLDGRVRPLCLDQINRCFYLWLVENLGEKHCLYIQDMGYSRHLPFNIAFNTKHDIWMEHILLISPDEWTYSNNQLTFSGVSQQLWNLEDSINAKILTFWEKIVSSQLFDRWGCEYVLDILLSSDSRCCWSSFVTRLTGDGADTSLKELNGSPSSSFQVSVCGLSPVWGLEVESLPRPQVRIRRNLEKVITHTTLRCKWLWDLAWMIWWI